MDGWHNGGLSKAVRIVNPRALRDALKPYCEQCGGTSGPMAVHHIIYRSHQRLDIASNLICLCVWCHEKAHKDGAFNHELLMGRDIADRSKLQTLAPEWSGWCG